MATSNQTLNGTVYDFSGLGFTPGDVVVITGAGSGIGRATALSAAKSGLVAAVWDLNAAGAAETVRLVREAGGKALAVSVDVGSDVAVKAAWQATAALGPCPYLVNNAGPASSDTMPFYHNLLLAVGSMYRVTENWLAHTGDARSMVNMSSIAGNFTAGGSQPFYPTAKAGIAAYTRHLAVHHKGRPRANAVAPGFTLTPRTVPYLDNAGMRDSLASIPLGRPGYAEDIASAVLFLLSPAASYVNGVLLPVDGGWIHS